MTETNEQSPTHRRLILLRIDPVCSAQALRERHSRAVTAGFDGVEWPLLQALAGEGTALAAVHEDILQDAGQPAPTVAAVAAQCATTNVDRAASEVITLLPRAARMHAQCVNLTIPPISRNQAEGFARYQEAVNFAHALLHRVRFEAEASGVAVALEAGVGGALLSPVELRDLIDEANSWAVGACVDVGRAVLFGLPEDWLFTLKHRVHSVRMPEGPLLDQADRTTGGASVDFTAVHTVLDEIGYTRSIIIETSSGDPVSLSPKVAQVAG